MGAPIYHIPLHMLFSILSYLNLSLGVGVHRAYNWIAYQYGTPVALKSKYHTRVKKELPRPHTMAPPDSDEVKWEHCPECGAILYRLPIPPARKKKQGKQPVNWRSGVEAIVKKAIKGALVAGGGMAGSYIGQEKLGKRAGAYISRVIGTGDYKIMKNTLMAGSQGSSAVPRFGGGGPRSFRLQHKEFIGDVTGSTSFTNKTYSLNPGLYTVFPFASTVLS